MEHAADRGGPPIAAPVVAPVVNAPAVRLADVSAGYDDQVVLSGIDLDIEPGTLTSVVGPNGAGKSTLLKVIAGLLPIRHGDVRVLGEAPGGAAHRIAYVPQAELVDWQFPVSVEDVVAMGRYPRLAPFRRLDREDRRQVAGALEIVGMADFADRQIGQLSGGQRRRVFIARALAAEPELFLLDEPVTGIDVTTQEEILDILEAQARAGRTVLATTHDLLCAAERFQRVVAINRTVIAHGPSSLILDRDVLRQTYGGHLLILDGQTVALDDAHHHDQSPGAEAHYHEGSQR